MKILIEEVLKTQMVCTKNFRFYLLFLYYVKFILLNIYFNKQFCAFLIVAEKIEKNCGRNRKKEVKAKLRGEIFLENGGGNVSICLKKNSRKTQNVSNGKYSFITISRNISLLFFMTKRKLKIYIPKYIPSIG